MLPLTVIMQDEEAQGIHTRWGYNVVVDVNVHTTTPVETLKEGNTSHASNLETDSTWAIMHRRIRSPRPRLRHPFGQPWDAATVALHSGPRPRTRP